MFKNWNLQDVVESQYSYVDIVIAVLTALLLLPYLFVAQYNVPSVDDYSYALKALDFGYWGGQAEAYKQWNGRYFASFILCLNIISGKGLFFYKLLPVVLIFMSIHAIYKILSEFSHDISKLSLTVLSTFIVLTYLNFMPSIAQGIYWEPGAITYHLGNIVFTYFLGNLIQCFTKSNALSLKLKLIPLTILACGLNESIMIAVVLVTATALLMAYKYHKPLQLYITSLLILAILCTVIMAVAPGNHIRDIGFLDPQKKNFTYTITASFSTLFSYLKQWLLTPSMLLFSLSTAVIFVKIQAPNQIKDNRSFIKFLIVFVAGFCIVAATLAPGFWSTGYIAPDRTINSVYWVFLLWWFVSMYFFSVLMVGYIQNVYISQHLTLGLLLAICAFYYGQSYNYNRAIGDIVTGRAYIYHTEFKNRLHLIEDSKKNSICELPEYSVIPGTIFFEDLKFDSEDWFNKEFARFYGLQAVQLVKQKTSDMSSICVNFDEKETKGLRMPVNLSSDFSVSAPNSNFIQGDNNYGATYETSIGQIDPSGLKLKRIIMTTKLLSVLPEVNCVMVVSIDDAQGKNVMWLGKDIVNPNTLVNQWGDFVFECTINESMALKPDNKLSVYIWNRGKGLIYSDDLCLRFE